LRRFIQLLVASALAAGTVVALGGAGQAQTGSGDLTAFCAGRIEANATEGKAEDVAVLTKMAAAAPPAVSTQMTSLLELVKKKGEKAFESKEGAALLAQLEPYIYDNCPGKQVPITAIDYEYQGLPATLPAGVTKFKMTNSAPKEGHMIAIVKVQPGNESTPTEKILSLPEKKQGKILDFSDAGFAEAEPGASGYFPMNLTPGKYVYACFFPEGGKKNGKPHFLLGMQGEFTVS
jgi:hypothetical protein